MKGDNFRQVTKAFKQFCKQMVCDIYAQRWVAATFWLHVAIKFILYLKWMHNGNAGDDFWDPTVSDDTGMGHDRHFHKLHACALTFIYHLPASNSFLSPFAEISSHWNTCNSH